MAQSQGGQAVNCPYCNSPVLLNDVAGNPWYQCGTTKTFRSASCVDREPLATELRSALARIKRLEEVGDEVVINYVNSLSAFEMWRKAKEVKP